MTRITDSVNKSSQKPSIKFLYSYNGKILPRPIDGKLRYVGGHTRVLAVDRSVTYDELTVKFLEACGSSIILKCKLPSEDLDVLVTVNSDEDLAAVVEEYDRVSPELKIRAIIFPVTPLKTISPVPSADSLVDYSSSKPPLNYPAAHTVGRRYPVEACRNIQPVSSRFRRDSNPKLSYIAQRCNYSR
ncbi:RAF-like serine/threonine-protein kinase PRAF [Rutidosis leptorrhynchoides]|uniref:RAF-like serine/threonine-protein kinase PRAF n=1 Tax=Rutidosis leptorrhynchoides TaxID=125765 RepID=UPI003A99EB21